MIRGFTRKAALFVSILAFSQVDLGAAQAQSKDASTADWDRVNALRCARILEFADLGLKNRINDHKNAKRKIFDYLLKFREFHRAIEKHTDILSEYLNKGSYYYQPDVEGTNTLVNMMVELAREAVGYRGTLFPNSAAGGLEVLQCTPPIANAQLEGQCLGMRASSEIFADLYQRANVDFSSLKRNAVNLQRAYSGLLSAAVKSNRSLDTSGINIYEWNDPGSREASQEYYRRLDSFRNDFYGLIFRWLEPLVAAIRSDQSVDGHASRVRTVLLDNCRPKTQNNRPGAGQVLSERTAPAPVYSNRGGDIYSNRGGDNGSLFDTVGDAYERALPQGDPPIDVTSPDSSGRAGSPDPQTQVDPPSRESFAESNRQNGVREIGGPGAPGVGDSGAAPAEGSQQNPENLALTSPQQGDFDAPANERAQGRNEVGPSFGDESADDDLGVPDPLYEDQPEGDLGIPDPLYGDPPETDLGMPDPLAEENPAAEAYDNRTDTDQAPGDEGLAAEQPSGEEYVGEENASSSVAATGEEYVEQDVEDLPGPDPVLDDPLTDEPFLADGGSGLDADPSFGDSQDECGDASGWVPAHCVSANVGPVPQCEDDPSAPLCLSDGLLYRDDACEDDGSGWVPSECMADPDLDERDESLEEQELAELDQDDAGDDPWKPRDDIYGDDDQEGDQAGANGDDPWAPDTGQDGSDEGCVPRLTEYGMESFCGTEEDFAAEVEARNESVFARDSRTGGSVDSGIGMGGASEAGDPTGSGAYAGEYATGTSAAGCSDAELEAEAKRVMDSMGSPPNSASGAWRFALDQLYTLRALHVEMGQRCNRDMSDALKWDDENIRNLEAYGREVGFISSNNATTEFDSYTRDYTDPNLPSSGVTDGEAVVNTLEGAAALVNTIRGNGRTGRGTNRGGATNGYCPPTATSCR